MRRRQFFTTLALFLPLVARGRTAADASDLRRLHTDWRAFLPTDHTPVAATPPLARSHAAWRDELPAEAYRVLFEEATERPHSSVLDRERRAGVYCCRACGLALFTSAMKYDSGTGWPSFFTAIPDHLGTRRDFKLIWPRTEYHCVKCGGHQGHVFDDGPAPTGQRWCNNGVALTFLPRQGSAAATRDPVAAFQHPSKA